MRLVWRTFGDLSVDELHAVLKLRCDVFVVEQQCAYADIDGRDPVARHLLALDDGDAPAGALRLLHDPDGMARLGRIVVRADRRGSGLGRRMLAEAHAALARQGGDGVVRLSAQGHLVAFYRSLGYEPVSGPYLEDGIPHIDMVRPPDRADRRQGTP